MNLQKMNPHETVILPLAGYPVGAVTAPLLYNSLFEFYELNALCLPVEVKRGELSRFIDAAKLLNLPGFILTMPHKQDIIPLLDEVDENAKLANSVNAVRIREGKTFGAGFDGIGVVGAFEATGTEMKDKSVLMIGAGGISGSCALQLAAKGIKKLTILNRTPEKAKRVADMLNANTNVIAEYGELTPERTIQAAKDADIVLQATCLGLKIKQEDYENLDFLDVLPKTASVLEVVTNPPETKFIQRAKANGLRYVLGLEMMVYQMKEMMKFIMDFEVTGEGQKIAREFYCDRFGYTEK